MKAIQSRKFLKHPNEVLNAAKTYCEDRGPQHAILNPARKDQDGNLSIGSGVVTCIFTPKFEHSFFGGVKATGISQIKFETISATLDSIELRARFFSGFPSPAQKVNADEYDALFKSIGNSIFVESLKIEAAVQE